MTTLSKSPEPADSLERERAATTFDRNVVVTAGAGTGKTTLLVDRLVHLLMRREPGPLKITEIVALTFTNRAANEMKLRLRERLESHLGARLDESPAGPREERLHEEVRSLLQRYHLSKSHMDDLAREALRNIERSEIGTIHSFAATLLRLYPIEAGVDPQFREDEGAGFERLFQERWSGWLDQELSGRGARREEWKRVLRRVELEEIRDLAFSLCFESVLLDRIVELSGKRSPSGPLLLWLEGLKEGAAALLRRHPEQRVNERLVAAALAIIEKFLAAGEIPEGEIAEGKDFLLSGRTISKTTRGWGEEEIGRAQEILRAARGLCQVDGSLISLLCELLLPFAESFREAFTREGLVSFDGLLVRARNLIRDHPQVREELKRRFRAILIDEFQDTDPIQYEILLYLAEKTGRHAGDWRGVELAPGKIFVVGDPKQSIYAFRRADIEAYLEVIEKVIKAQDGVEYRLTTNFRSHAGILDVVNGVFEHLIRPKEGLQPPYVPIHPAQIQGAVEPEPMPLRSVTLRNVGAAEEKMDSELALRLEAESLARWLAEDVLDKAEILNRDGERVRAQPKDVAILLRKLTDVHRYLEPLRRRGIRYVVEGERHFYAVQEIIDAVNLLRAVENPCDRPALVGLLRSPLGGLKDREIYELHRRGLLDYRAVERLRGAGNLNSAVADLYETLSRLHEESLRLPVGEAIARIFDALPIRLLAAHSFHAEQAVANLEKLRRQAETMGREGSGTLKEVIFQLQRRVQELKEEGESALAEENLDAVKVLSVHKAKGLEFPVVILAGCHTRADSRHGGRAEAVYDWSTGLAGLRAGQYWSLAGLYIAEKQRRREEEEQKRLLYVAMTRAREHLMISCAPGERSPGGGLLSLLEEALQRDLSSVEQSAIIPAGAGALALQVVTERLSPPARPGASGTREREISNWKAYARIWQRRTEEYEAAGQQPRFLTPTLLKEREAELSERLQDGTGRAEPPTRALLIGDLAHRFLQNWDFTADPAGLGGLLRPFLEKSLNAGLEADRDSLYKELEEIFEPFFRSRVYRELSTSRILGREVPLLMSWDGGRIMEGVIDLIYEKDGALYLADYKTDRVEKKDLAEVAQRYLDQVRIYSEAARRSLEREVAGFKLIFLRLGEATEI